MLRAVSLIFLASLAFAQTRPTGTWKFAVSGDSRNCGDIVMPAIARGVHNSGAQFYWHLGDFRAVYEVDEDMSAPQALGLHNGAPTLAEYQKQAWQDFIAHQIVPFGTLPVYLIMGNHEAIPPMTRDAWLIQFADWLETPALRAQRLKDDPLDHKLHSYFHWVQNNVDFIALDNATTDQFDPDQMKWLKSVLARDEALSSIRTIVVGMHEALPGSKSSIHSMSETPIGNQTGREAYEAMWHAQESAHKHVYVLASHSHFYMDHIFDTTDWKDKVLPGWIIGTAGAIRYKLPPEATPAQHAQTNVYGYMVGTVSKDGTVAFDFRPLSIEDLRAANGTAYPEPLVRWCYENNHQ
ncbi:MAG TPA: metallophosphoesterase [Bryobacteraceae bacterium]|nr:metallophosphoesterase [Bryobacteraceae bacterium]